MHQPRKRPILLKSYSELCASMGIVWQSSEQYILQCLLLKRIRFCRLSPFRDLQNLSERVGGLR
jgi:hypothetical protein